jgi:hypothetical protein
MVLETVYNNNRNKPTLSALRIAHVGSPAQPGPSRGLLTNYTSLTLFELRCLYFIRVKVRRFVADFNSLLKGGYIPAK